MSCPVPIWAMLLRSCYALSGAALLHDNDQSHAASRPWPTRWAYRQLRSEGSCASACADMRGARCKVGGIYSVERKKHAGVIAFHKVRLSLLARLNVFSVCVCLRRPVSCAAEIVCD
eukprot:3033597-Rhodomonas_salina.4